MEYRSVEYRSVEYISVEYRSVERKSVEYRSNPGNTLDEMSYVDRTDQNISALKDLDHQVICPIYTISIKAPVTWIPGDKRGKHVRYDILILRSILRIDSSTY